VETSQIFRKLRQLYHARTRARTHRALWSHIAYSVPCLRSKVTWQSRVYELHHLSEFWVYLSEMSFYFLSVCNCRISTPLKTTLMSVTAVSNVKLAYLEFGMSISQLCNDVLFIVQFIVMWRWIKGRKISRRNWLFVDGLLNLNSQITSLSTAILVLGKSRSRGEPNLGCRGADRSGLCDALPEKSVREPEVAGS
jgi:hypothetical protein